MHKDGIVFKLCIHFTANRGAAMFTQDIASRWKVDAKQIAAYTKNAKRDGLIEARTSGRETYYVAGEALLKAMEDS